MPSSSSRASPVTSSAVFVPSFFTVLQQFEERAKKRKLLQDAAL
jgi:hypothetical protein